MSFASLKLLVPLNESSQLLCDKLDEYAKSGGNFGHFDGLYMIDAEKDLVTAWFDGDRNTAGNFAPFASTNQSGVFAIWIDPGNQRTDNPVVFLGSEGEALVIAANLSEFLQLLALPCRDVEYCFANRAWRLYDHDHMTEELLEFRSWLKHNLNIEPAAQPDELVDAAQARFPVLLKWVEEWADVWFSGNP